MKRREPIHVGFDMTPMIDVTFNLIIFFMLVSEFAKAQIVELELPEPAKEVIEIPKDSSLVIINVTQNNGVINKISCDGHDWRPEEFGDLLVRLRALKSDQLQIELRADKRLKWNQVADLMLACAEKGIAKINFVAKKD